MGAAMEPGFADYLQNKFLISLNEALIKSIPTGRSINSPLGLFAAIAQGCAFFFVLVSGVSDDILLVTLRDLHALVSFRKVANMYFISSLFVLIH